MAEAPGKSRGADHRYGRSHRCSRLPPEAGMSVARPVQRGRLKVFLSYAAGAGKTYRMLEEAQELLKNGVDVVVGYFEPHGRKDTIELTKGLELLPRRTIEYRGVAFEEMDTNAIIERRPMVCAVDEFART